jgi:hypothetical protein
MPKMNNEDARKAIRDFRKTGDLRAIETSVSVEEAQDWVRMRLNPRRFAASIFVGSWGDPSKHPVEGDLRILRVITGPDGVTRAIARQGKHLYCFSDEG